MMNYISSLRHIALTLVVIVAAMVAPAAMAQAPYTTWGGTPVKPQGYGTEVAPYLIESRANLEWVRRNHNNGRSGSTPLYFKQMADIDMRENGVDPSNPNVLWECLGVNNTDEGVFLGHYDGNGHTISNIYVDWGALTTEANCNRGFFCSFGGTFRNVNIVGAKIELANTTYGSTSTNYDPRIGVVAGLIISGAVIENVSITESIITDGGRGKQSAYKGIIVGGAVAEVRQSPTGTSTIKPNVTLRYLFVQTDIDLTTFRISVHASRGAQYHAGGIIGRIRSGSVDNLPLHSIYSGTINAPYAMIGPIWSIARWNSDNCNTVEMLMKMYTGEYASNKYIGSTGAPTGEGRGYFYNYQVSNGATFVADDGTGHPSWDIVEVNDAVPSPTGQYEYGTRTFLETKGANRPDFYTSTISTIDPTWMACLQGVNHGSYLPAANRYTLEDELNATTNTTLTPNSTWSYDEETQTYKITKETTCNIEITSLTDYFGVVSNGRSDYVFEWCALPYSLGVDGIEISATDPRWQVIARTDATPDPTLVSSLTTNDDRTTINISLVNPTQWSHLMLRLYRADGTTPVLDPAADPADHKLLYGVSPCLGHAVVTRTTNFDDDGEPESFTYWATPDFPAAVGTYGITKIDYLWRISIDGGTTWQNATPPEVPSDPFAPPSAKFNKPSMVVSPTVMDMWVRVDMDVTFSSGTVLHITGDDGARWLQHALQISIQSHSVAYPFRFSMAIHDNDNVDWSHSNVLAANWEATDGASISIGWSDDVVLHHTDTSYAEVKMNDVPASNYQFSVRASFRMPYGGTANSPYETIYLINIDVAQPERNLYTASLNYTQYGEPLEVSDGAWQWEYAESAPDDDTEWKVITGETSESLVFDPDLDYYYRVTWTSPSGRTVISQVVGPLSVIYVYDSAMTTRARTDSAVRNRYTTFTGYDADGTLYPDGNDINNGATPYTAVKTMRRAYELLSRHNSTNRNIIVVMGYYEDVHYLISVNDEYLNYDKPATITGNYGDISDGALWLGNNANQAVHMLAAPTTFTNISICGNMLLTSAWPSEWGTVPTSTNAALTLYANFHDITFDGTVRMLGYYVEASSNQGMRATDKQPKITLVGGTHNFDDSELPERPYNNVPNLCTITLRSGSFARVIAGGRNSGLNPKSRNILGSPANPHRVKVIVDINDATHFGNVAWSGGVKVPVTNDIGLLVGGQTDGSIWSDASITLLHGEVGRFISGNITYGRRADDTYAAKPTHRCPSDSYFGRTLFEMKGGIVHELYGGMLGRLTFTNSPGRYAYTDNCMAYYYGSSDIVISGGVVESDIYAGGAGSVTGYAGPLHRKFTSDPFVPYLRSADGILVYGSHEEIEADGGTLPVMELSDGTQLQLFDTASNVYVSGGRVKGDIYGGGMGFSNSYGYKMEQPFDHAENVAARNRALPDIGSLYGSSHIIVDSDESVIEGNIFGGGAGAPYFVRPLLDADGNPVLDADGNPMTSSSMIATTYGNTSVVVTAGHVMGSIYGAGRGVVGHPDMAAVYGNTSVTVGGTAQVDGNIFGAGAIGSVRDSSGEGIIGNTSVVIEGGVIGNSIFGGGMGRLGDDGTPEGEGATPCRVDGQATVLVTGGTYSPEAYFEETDEYGTVLSRTAKNFNIYGGAYYYGTVGSTSVTINRSLLTNLVSLPEALDFDGHETGSNDFATAWEDVRYRHFCVYGAGWGRGTDVLGNASVLIDIKREGGFSQPTPDVVTMHPGQTFFDVAGGGFLGNVQGNATTRIEGMTFARKVMGGAFYSSIFGDSKLQLVSGTFESVIGGSIIGYVHGSAITEIGTRGTDEATATSNAMLYVLGNVYGGNDVAGITGTTSEAWKDSDSDPTANTYYQASTEHGVKLNIFGGRVLGDVYGAGNGYYRGYYNPRWTAYRDADISRYRIVPPSAEDPDHNTLVYRTRPQTAHVEMLIQGNSTTDRVNIDGSLYGGGRMCTIGQMNPTLSLENPQRFIGGGSLAINFGSHVTVGESVYMGTEGSIVGQQSVKSATDRTYQYDHWYYSEAIGDYRLGFAPVTEYPSGYPVGAYDPENPEDPANGYMGARNADRNKRLTGEELFHGYMRTVEMNCPVSLTFYDSTPYIAGTETTTRDLRQFPKAWTDGGGHTWSGTLLAVGHELLGVDTYTFDSEDIVFGDFYVGGKSGSMTYQDFVGTTPTECAYEFALPPGLTVINKVVGGSERAWARMYPYTAGGAAVDNSGEPLYQYRGGIITSMLTSDVTTDPETGNQQVTYGAKIERDAEFNAVELTVSCKFEPRRDPDTNRPYGALIYGGCYESGFTEGSIYINVSSHMYGSDLDITDHDKTREYTSLRYNTGRVFGGGFGERTVVTGAVNLQLARNFRGFNVFGGSQKGVVRGATTVRYIGTEQSYIWGAIYGGGLQGTVGSPTVDPNHKWWGSRVELLSGNVGHVYGGGCIGDVYGGTTVEISDEMTSLMETPGWGASRLIVGSVFGGNDVAGTVHAPDQRLVDEGTRSSYTLPDDPLTKIGYRTIVRTFERPDTEKAGANENGYNGFPLVGNIYGGSSGDYGVHGTDGYYADGSLEIANGIGDQFETVWLSGRNDLNEEVTTPLSVPEVASTLIEMRGGTVINAFGGGDMSTITDRVQINVNYADTTIRASFEREDEFQRAWRVMRMSNDEQRAEVIDVRTADNGISRDVFKYQIFRLFGGNDHADMSIQPRWNLVKGHIGSCYSGANFGGMTYYNPSANPADDDPWMRSKGLSIWITEPDIHIEALYGGGRVGDIAALRSDGTMTHGKLSDDDTDYDFEDDEYGATVNVTAGLIEAVYGGNDVAGVVYNGTNVNIKGAISGDVYGAGNGNYRYFVDTAMPLGSRITEDYDEEHGFRYFHLPPMAQYGGQDPSPSQKVMLINHYRPNVDKAYLNIEGTPPPPGDPGDPIVGTTGSNRVWVKGYVYCGGNSSTVSPSVLPANGELPGIRFRIGSYVTLNGVFMGSNGATLSSNQMLYDLAELNGITLSDPNTLEEDMFPEGSLDRDAANKTLYPNLLSLVMRGVDVYGMPENFGIDENLQDAYIGLFTAGGNRGSLLTDRTVTIELPRSLTIFGGVIGGCFGSMVDDGRGAFHKGGLPKPLATGFDKKVHLKVRSKFRPFTMKYPSEVFGGQIELVPDESPMGDLDMYHADRCNVYGGCYQSGITVGGVQIDLYSDMLDYWAETPAVDKQWIVNGVEKQRRTFAIIGAGYGPDTEMRGDVHINLLPDRDSENNHVSPSCASIFAGSQEGSLIGNTYVTVRDGDVLTNIYGGSESSILYGSTQILIGYPDYYLCTTTGEYSLRRTDDGLSRIFDPRGETGWPANVDYDGNQIVKTSVRYRQGDWVPANVYEMITNSTKASCFTPVTGETPASLPGDFTWDDITINIGYNEAVTSPTSAYYGHGNIYGGGFIGSSTTTVLNTRTTVARFDADNNPDMSLSSPLIGYGGNTAVMVSDNPHNCDINFTGAEGEALRDHVSIGTGHYVNRHLQPGDERSRTFVWNPNPGHQHFEHQSAGPALEGYNYYKLVADGGIYGGGRMVYAAGFTACDVRGYGYATYTPQHPKLLNTFQCFDVLRVEDCCLQLHGARDLTPLEPDPTDYALTRIGELQMVTSLPYATSEVDPGSVDSDVLAGHLASEGNIIHYTPRTRNYLAFFSPAHYVGSISSNVSFDSPYHKEDGTISGSTDTYRSVKTDKVNTYYSFARKTQEEIDAMSAEDQAAYQEALLTAQTIFDQRNVGTAANMIGICNGYTLKVQGVWTENEDGEERSYFGPIEGVFEIKLLTLAENEGGGYIYALNLHDEAPAASPAPARVSSDDLDDREQSFVYTTGNFVFPGAAFLSLEGKYNYIHDDCYPPGRGYDYYKSLDADGNVNVQEEQHYWFVNGTRFFFNATIGAYTTAKNEGEHRDWFINNSDQLIYLAGLYTDYESLKITNVRWTTHDETFEPDPDVPGDAYHSDVRDTSKAYSLYLTIDQDTRAVATEADHSGTPNAYVADIPRTDRTTPIAGVGSYQGDDNTPLVGIRLRDEVDNGGREYYEEHLKYDDEVQIVIEAVDAKGVTYTYTINLDIRYMLGPSLTGHIAIENCALPGELIYANADNVTIELDDETMRILDRGWYLIPLIEDAEGKPVSPMRWEELDGSGLVELSDDCYYEAGNMTRVALPAYYYQNNWRLMYRVKVLGMDLYGVVDDTDDDALHTLVVHNYHRMKAIQLTDADNDPSSHATLNLVEGARIYLEDPVDLAYFIEYLHMLQTTPGTGTFSGRELPGTVRRANPQYARGLRFLLMNDLKIPESVTDYADLRFDGEWHGDGFTVTLPVGREHVFGQFNGSMHNAGFIDNDSNGSVIIADNQGTVENCYYLSRSHAGGLIGSGNDGDNCYSNVEGAHGVEYALDNKFRFGAVTYYLNRHYLQERQALMDAGLDPHAINPADYLETAGLAQNEYLRSLFADGEYRFARYDRSGLNTACLRTDSVPNYNGWLGRGTHHNANDPVDTERWSEIDNAYRPLWDGDLIFFGQVLGLTDATSDQRPYPYVKANRVYRVSGFYGSKIDEGFYFNADAAICNPDLTAVDFSCFRDYPGRRLTADSHFFLPMRDMPEADDFSLLGIRSTSDLESYDGASRNLLVYTTTNDTYPVDPVVHAAMESALMYDQTTAETDIIGHHITGDAATGEYATDMFDSRDIYPTNSYGLLHLVDKQPFNAPIPFTVTGHAWYTRMPASYSMGNTGWEGIIVPFDANMVTADMPAGQDVAYSHGELTHFYGADKILHEYWLRGLTGADASVSTDVKLYFSRPGNAADGLFDYGKKADYHYVNTWFWDTYRNASANPLSEYQDYVEAHNMYTSDGTDFEGYRFMAEYKPYIVALPGSRYYEFDCSGNFLNDVYPNLPVVPQMLTMHYYSDRTGLTNADAGLSGPLTIGVTDDYDIATTARGYVHKGSFSHKTYNYSDGVYGINDEGTAFTPVTEVLPFRTYVFTSGLSRSALRIGYHDQTDPETEPADSMGEATDITFAIEHNQLVVRSPRATTVTVWAPSGMKVCDLNVDEGTNVYDFNPGIYMAGSYKFLIR